METSVDCSYHLSNSPNAVLIGLAKARPNIKHIELITSVEMVGNRRVVRHPRPDKIRLLGGLKYLSPIEVVYRYIDDFSVGPKPRYSDQVVAEAVLKKS